MTGGRPAPSEPISGQHTALTGREGTLHNTDVPATNAVTGDATARAVAAGDMGKASQLTGAPVGDQLKAGAVSDSSNSTGGLNAATGGMGQGGPNAGGEVDAEGNAPKKGFTQKLKEFIAS